jgi:SAM-dependent methyltransferase
MAGVCAGRCTDGPVETVCVIARIPLRIVDRIPGSWRSVLEAALHSAMLARIQDGCITRGPVRRIGLIPLTITGRKNEHGSGVLPGAVRPSDEFTVVFMITNDTRSLGHQHLARNVSIEFRKCYSRWEREGLIDRYLSGSHILDIGFRGGDPNAVPITESAVGIELDYPGYDGIHLPFGDGSQDAVFASAVFEHIPDYRDVLAEWYRVLRVGGYILIFVPHKYLYEKRADLPSRWNGDHRRFYTPSSLLREIEESLPCNGFRVRHLVDNDEGFRYDEEQESPPKGNYQIEILIEKISRPAYSNRLEYTSYFSHAIDNFDQIVINSIVQLVENPDSVGACQILFRSTGYFTPWHRLEAHFIYSEPAELGGRRLSREGLKAIVRPWLDLVDVDEKSYVRRYQQLKDLRDPALHWRNHGYFEGRLGTSFDFGHMC